MRNALGVVMVDPTTLTNYKYTASGVVVGIKTGSFLGQNTGFTLEADYKTSSSRKMQNTDIALVYVPLRDATHEDMCSITSGQ